MFSVSTCFHIISISLCFMTEYYSTVWHGYLTVMDIWIVLWSIWIVLLCVLTHDCLNPPLLFNLVSVVSVLKVWRPQIDVLCLSICQRWLAKNYRDLLVSTTSVEELQMHTPCLACLWVLGMELRPSCLCSRHFTVQGIPSPSSWLKNWTTLHGGLNMSSCFIFLC